MQRELEENVNTGEGKAGEEHMIALGWKLTLLS